jgi:hypothetical protein
VSLIPARHVCPECDGYTYPGCRLASRCRCNDWKTALEQIAEAAAYASCRPHDGMTFDLDPPAHMRLFPPKGIEPPVIWRCYDVGTMFLRIAPIDRTCIPPEITRASFERCLAEGVARPCSVVEA